VHMQMHPVCISIRIDFASTYYTYI
jgi:hypothetical protein